MPESKKKTGCLTQGCLLTVAFIGLVALIPAIQMGGGRDIGVLPVISLFLHGHPEFGIPASTQDVPNWVKGQRQRVTFEGGRSLLFYLDRGKVVTVYEDVPGKGRQKVWGEYSGDE